MTPHEPRFNLKAVVRQTGLKPDTLRAWERRYGLPTPERSPGGHRIYSQSDIETLKWLVARQREGLSIRRAVDLWRQIESQGRDPLRAATPIATQAAPVPPSHPEGAIIGALRQGWIDACLAYDERRAEQIVNQAFALYRPETVVLELLQRAVAQIGEGWYQGHVTVQQEHFCSGLVIRHLEALVMAAPPPTRPGRIVLACPAHEQHVIGPLILTFLLRRRGWEVVYLGADVPLEQLAATVAATRPQLLIVPAQRIPTAASLLDMARVLRQEHVPLAYGGLIFNLLPALRRRIPGHFLGEQLETAPQVVESLMTAPRPAPTPEAIPERYRQARKHFHERQGLIDAHVIQALHDHNHNHLALANQELGRNIDAALALGDLDLLGSDLEWVTGLLRNYQVPAQALPGYLHAYHQAASEQLDERGRPITDWLGKLLGGDAPG